MIFSFSRNCVFPSNPNYFFWIRETESALKPPVGKKKGFGSVLEFGIVLCEIININIYTQVDLMGNLRKQPITSINFKEL